jgi:uncharacterized protein (TIGR00288 family)
VTDPDRALAIFIDFENLALGFQGRRDRFDIHRVLERLVEKGKVVAKKAYADWSRFGTYTAPLHEAAIELIEIPRRAQTGKNSADIRLCVDAMDLAYSKEHIDTFVVVSGDSDFSPLVSKLKELGKHVIGLGMQASTSDLLRDNCDEFIYYEDLGQAPALAPSLDAQLPETKRKAFALLLESLLALRRENKEVLWSSMIKDTMKRKKPSFNETYHGYRTFSELLEDAARSNLLELDTDKRSRTYVVTRFGSEMTAAPTGSGDGSNGKKKSRRRRGSAKRKTLPGRPAEERGPNGGVPAESRKEADTPEPVEDRQETPAVEPVPPEPVAREGRRHRRAPVPEQEPAAPSESREEPPEERTEEVRPAAEAEEAPARQERAEPRKTSRAERLARQAAEEAAPQAEPAEEKREPRRSHRAERAVKEPEPAPPEELPPRADEQPRAPEEDETRFRY